MPRRGSDRSRPGKEKVSCGRWPMAGRLSWIINSTNPPAAEPRNLPAPGAVISLQTLFVPYPMPDLNRAAWRRSRPPLPLAVLSLALLHAHSAWAQDADLDAPLVLKRTP